MGASSSTPLRALLAILGQELVRPTTYVIAALIGVLVQLGQGLPIFGSWVVYVVPVVVQVVARTVVQLVRDGRPFHEVVTYVPSATELPFTSFTSTVMPPPGAVVAADPFRRRSDRLTGDEPRDVRSYAAHFIRKA